MTPLSSVLACYRVEWTPFSQSQIEDLILAFRAGHLLSRNQNVLFAIRTQTILRDVWAARKCSTAESNVKHSTGKSTRRDAKNK